MTLSLDSINRNESLVDQVVKLLQQSSGSMPTIDIIAQQVHMSTTTLQRKLKAEQTTFRQIKEQGTYQQATSLLVESSKSIENIADQLGYSDASNFTKAFKSGPGRRRGSLGGLWISSLDQINLPHMHCIGDPSNSLITKWKVPGSQ